LWRYELSEGEYTMRINRQGITRIVIEFQKVVVKIPNFTYSFKHFLQGWEANLDEKFRWNLSHSDLLCPVVGSYCVCFFLVMKKADMKRHEEEIRNLPTVNSKEDAVLSQQNFYRIWIEEGYGGDDKPDNYGYIDGRLVKVDYPN
jgi:hypothetical protein